MPEDDRRKPLVEQYLSNESATRALAADVAAMARPGDIFALGGDLGTGKTVFARAFVQARCRGQDEVPSPTFTLVQTYDCPDGPVHHFDLFRLSTSEEAYELGIEDAFAEGISLIEWPERLGSLLPVDRLSIVLTHANSPETRRIAFHGEGKWPERLTEVGLA